MTLEEYQKLPRGRHCGAVCYAGHTTQVVFRKSLIEESLQVYVPSLDRHFSYRSLILPAFKK